MPRKIESTSDASQKRIDRAYSQAFTGILKTLEAINNKLNEGKTLTDEELRFLKKSDSIIRTMQLREKQKEEVTGILPEVLKDIRDKMEWRESLGKEENILKTMNYYRCSECREMHKLGEECIFHAYEKLLKSKKENFELEE